MLSPSTGLSFSATLKCMLSSQYNSKNLTSAWIFERAQRSPRISAIIAYFEQRQGMLRHSRWFSLYFDEQDFFFV